jgi:hypothetical protein
MVNAAVLLSLLLLQMLWLQLLCCNCCDCSVEVAAAAPR